MVIQSANETIENIFTTMPENVVFSDALLWVGTSVLVTWMIVLTLCGRPKRRKLFVGSVLTVAATLGTYGYILYQSTNENLGGYYLGHPTEDMLFPEVDADPDSPGKDYVLYLPGAIVGKRLRSDIVKTDTCAVIPHGYNAEVRRFAARLRPRDRLHLIGFSRGGGEALALAQTIRRPIASLVLADPTADILQALEYRLGTCRKPGNVEYFKVFTVPKYDAPTDSNEIIRKYHYFMVAKFIDRRYLEWLTDNDHGMRSSGYRIDESSRSALEGLRDRVLKDRALSR